jgi:ATP-dependent DNA helicase RecG
MFTHRVYETLDDNIEYTKDRDFDEIQANVMILDYLSKNECITRKEVERLCGFSPATSKRILKELREQEKIVLEGLNKSSRYKLKK